MLISFCILRLTCLLPDKLLNLNVKIAFVNAKKKQQNALQFNIWFYHCLRLPFCHQVKSIYFNKMSIYMFWYPQRKYNVCAFFWHYNILDFPILRVNVCKIHPCQHSFYCQTYFAFVSIMFNCVVFKKKLKCYCFCLF